MPNPLTLELAVKLVPFEPDGSECSVCEDVIYLEGMKMIFVVPTDGNKKVGELYFKFCQSCGNALEDAMGKEDERWS